MITCVVEYVIDPARIDAFERFARRWMELVDRHGGVHHGYFLPAEGASDRALALFSFPSLADYETYRGRFGVDPEFVAADRIRDESGCVLRHERTFMRPLLPSADERPPAVRQLRLVVEAEDYDRAVAFYRDVLGLKEEAAFATGEEARVVILDAGRATLEIANPAQRRYIDEVEVGHDAAPHLRVAFEVDDGPAVTDRLIAAGATQVAPPTLTPWRSVNSRLDAPAGLHITVFQETEDSHERAARSRER